MTAQTLINIAEREPQIGFLQVDKFVTLQKKQA